MTKQSLIKREPKLLEHGFTLTIRCECGALRNFTIDANVRAMMERRATGMIVDTECEECKRRFEVGFGMDSNERFHTGRLPAYYKEEMMVIEDDMSLVPVSKQKI